MLNGIIVALDVGGSGARAYVLDLATRELLTPKPLAMTYDHREGAEPFFEKIVDLVLRAVAAAKRRPGEIVAIGSAIPGEADYRAGIMTRPSNMFGPGFQGFRFGPRLAEAFRCQVFCANDGDINGSGEMMFGYGKDRPDLTSLAILALGSGVGGGLQYHSAMYDTPGQHQCEFGHINVVRGAGARPCNCGMSGCLEAYISTHGINTSIAEIVDSHGASPIAQIWSATDAANRLREVPPQVFRLANEGDQVCADILRDMASHLGYGIAQIMNICNPQVVLIAGGLAEPGKSLRIDGKDLRQLATDAGRRYVFGAGQRERFDEMVQYGVLGNNAILLGAGAYAIQKYLQQQEF